MMEPCLEQVTGPQWSTRTHVAMDIYQFPDISVIVVVYSKRIETAEKITSRWANLYSWRIKMPSGQAVEACKKFKVFHSTNHWRFIPLHYTQHGWQCCNNILLALDWSRWVTESRTIALRVLDARASVNDTNHTHLAFQTGFPTRIYLGCVILITM